MQQLHINQIIIPENRQRREFDPAAIADLAGSIQSKGLLHPPVVRDVGNGNYALVAGERRLRAMITLLDIGDVISHNGEQGEHQHVPVTMLRDLTAIEIEEAELEENTCRVDLSWQELASAQARLHDLRSRQAAERGETQTFAATAAEILGRSSTDSLGAQPAKVANSVYLAKHLDDPEVAKAKTEKEALKIVEKKAKTAHFAKLAEEFGATKTECPHELIHGDSREELNKLPPNTFQVLLTDPPYGIDANSFGEQSGQGHNYDDNQEYFKELITELAEQSYRVCTTQAHAYVFCDPRYFRFIQGKFNEAGWDVWPIPLIWKKSTGMLPRPEHAPRRTYEAILYAIKGDKRVMQVKGDVIDVPSVRGLTHGAQKPVDLYCDLLSRSISPGDRILDPFCGSGTIFPAANVMNCIATGIEFSPDNCNIARLRMEEQNDGMPEINLDQGELEL